MAEQNQYDDPFAEDELTEEQEAQLRQQETDTSDLPAEEDEDDDKAAPAAKDKPQDTDTPAEEDDAEADGDADFQAFLDKHKNKSPEELAKLAYQQNRARAEARSEQRSTQDTLSSLMQRIAQSRESKQKSIEERRSNFERELHEDPDAAAKRMYEEQLQREQQDFDNRQWQEFISEQSRLTREHIPDFDSVQEDMLKYAVEQRGYKPQEVMAASDHRDIVTLHRAMQFDRLVQQGVIDQQGNPTGQVPAQTPQRQKSQGQLDRMKASGDKRAPRSLSDTRGTSRGNQAKSLQAQAEELLKMSDEDFEKVSDEDMERLLKEMG